MTGLLSTHASETFAVRVHGGTDALGAPRHDFSTNSHAMDPCPAAQSAVQAANATHYPDASYTALRRQLADFHGVNVGRLHLAASASEFIFRITAVASMGSASDERGRASVWLPPHSYGDYAQAALALRLTRADQPELATLRWTCEPSSPLGNSQSGLCEMALLSPASVHRITVLDRAYEPLRLSGASSLSAMQLDAVWQLWTPNKALGLTGVRAAYAIAPLDVGGKAGTDTALRLAQLCPSWPIGAHGVAMLNAWTTPAVQDWLADSLPTLRQWKTRQIGLCQSMGWVCLPSDANFFCAKPVLPMGISLQQALTLLRPYGIKLRDTTSFGLPGHVRVSVQVPASQDALQQAWQHIMATADRVFE